jgi:hypothetical protein
MGEGVVLERLGGGLRLLGAWVDACGARQNEQNFSEFAWVDACGARQMIA